MASFGDKNNLPARLSNFTNKENIVYWSTPVDDEPACCAMYCESAGLMVCFPCFWPHLLILSPIFCCYACYNKSKQIGTDAILTTTTLELIEGNGTVMSIPLENIKSVTATTKSQVPFTATCCMPDVNRLIIDDGRIDTYRHGQAPLLTILWCHDNMDEFRRRILDAKERRAQMANVAAAQMMMQQMQQQPMMMMQQPVMQQQPIMIQPMMIQSQSPSPGQPYPSNQQQPVAYGQSVAYGQPMIQQPYSYTPSFTSSAQVYPQPMNSNQYEYPKR